MSTRENVKLAVRRLANTPYLGRPTRICVAVWRAPQTRAILDETRATLNQTRATLDETRATLDETRATLDATTRKFQAILDGFGAAIRGMENSIRRHEIQFGTQKSSIDKKYNEHISALENQDRQISEKLGWISVDNDNIRSRIEFIRKEVMFELRKQLAIINTSEHNVIEKRAPRFVNKEKIDNAETKRLNLGCGHIIKDDFINVDARDIPGVDLIADVTSLPFDAGTIDTIYAAHLVEHFSERTLKDTVLRHWLDLLKGGGEMILIAPDADAMINGYIKSEFSFEELREVIFGGQEYDGDFHFTMLTPDVLRKSLKEIGFSSVSTIASGRKNGGCYEFEIHAKK